MYLPPISGNLSANEAETLAEWHEAMAVDASNATAQRRHEIIAFRLWKAAHNRRAFDRARRRLTPSLPNWKA